MDLNVRKGIKMDKYKVWIEAEQWADGILVDEISRERIEEVIKYLIIKDEIECIFKKIYYDDYTGIYSSRL
jgi:hypothetical protein